MKKVGIVVLLFFTLACGLTGCGTTGTQGSASASAAASVDPQLPTAAELGREEHTTIEMIVEGETEQVPATLFTQEGWSIYLPDEGWTQETDAEDRAITWSAAANDDVELTVQYFAGKTTEEVRTAILAEHDDYGFLDMNEENCFTGTDGADAETMEVRLVTDPEGVYALLLEYPDEAAEGFGARLAAIADTFETEVMSLAE